MVRADWEYINIPKEMYAKLKEISEDSTMRSKGLTSPRLVLTEIVRKYFEENDI